MGKRVYLGARSEAAFFTLLGISCHLRDYRLSHLFNHHLGFSFAKRDDLRIVSPSRQAEDEFSFYSFRDEERLNTFYLIGNRNQSVILIPEMKQFDFLVIVEGRFVKAEKDVLTKTLRSLPGIVAVIETRLTDIKNYESLLTDIEMHVMSVHKVQKIKYQPS